MTASARSGTAPAPNAWRDVQRLAAIHATVPGSVSPASTLDWLARTAARVLNVPVALVTLVDDQREWLVGRHGLGGALVDERNVPLSHAICQHVVAIGAPLIVPDAATDPLLRDSPAVAELGIRSYAGIPLMTATGETLGAFCAIDTVPREWRVEDVAMLHDLADVAMNDIQMRLALGALAASEAHYRNRIDLSPHVEWAADADGAIVELSERWHELTGDTASGALSARWLKLTHPDDRAQMIDHWTECTRTGAPYNVEHRLRVADGSYRWMCSRAWPSHNAAGAIDRWYGSTEDIEKQVTAGLERARADHEARELHHALFDTALDCFLTMDAAGRILTFNRAAEATFGYTAAEVKGELMADLIVPPAQRERMSRELARFAATGRSTNIGQRLEEWAMRRDGTVFPVEMAIVTLPLAGVPVFAVTLRDITVRHEAEEALRRSEERYRFVSLATDDVVWDADLRGRTMQWSEAVKRVFRYPNGEDANSIAWWRDRVHPEDSARVFRELAAVLDGRKNAWVDEYRFLRGDGTYADVSDRGYVSRDADGTAVRMIGAMVDRTKQHSLEQQLRQAQKMEAVGRLAGGVAHDFNNILTVITSYAGFLLSDIAPDAPMRDDVQQISDAADRAAALTRQLLAFSRQQVLEPQEVDLNELANEMEKMLRRLLHANITFTARLQPELGRVNADPGQLEQVIMNLVVNARDAMPDGGQIALDTVNVDLDDEQAATQVGVAPGAYVLLTVSDTGRGMDAETQARIFDPFFTTKPTGQGTGLGLATVYGIVEQSGGHVTVTSEPGHGSVFRVYLRRVESAGAQRLRSIARPAVLGGSETVLLVEDHAAVRRAARIILERAGYTVLEAEGGPQALEIARRPGVTIDLLLTDMVMPLLSGRELATEFQAIHPAAATLYMSGYTEDAVRQRNVFEPGVVFVQKPFTPQRLGEKVREALEAGPAHRS